MVRPDRAFPPHFSVRSRDNLIRNEVAVFRRVPLGSNVWKDGGKGIGHRRFLPGTEWAPSALFRSNCNSSPPNMVWAFRALPPHFSVRSRHNLIRSEITVLCRVPLSCDARKEHRKGICAACFFSSAERTPLPTRPIRNARIPLMGRIYWTAPPHFLVAARRHVIRRDAPVLCRMPLGRKFGMGLRQRLFHRSGSLGRQPQFRGSMLPHVAYDSPHKRTVLWMLEQSIRFGVPRPSPK
jgi:hypothetical protein